MCVCAGGGAQNFGDQITSPDTIRKYTKMGDLVDQGSISRVGGEGGLRIYCTMD